MIRNREKDVEKQRAAVRQFEKERQEQIAGREARIRDLRYLQSPDGSSGPATADWGRIASFVEPAR